jgi:ribosomal protein S18 acetylase RimI-like enzyme
MTAPDLDGRMGAEVLAWVCAAGNPYFEFLFGSAEKATKILSDWMIRPSSEISITRTSIMLVGSDLVGGFVAMGGVDLKKARKADTIALAKVKDPNERAFIVARLSDCAQLFSTTLDGEYYLSKMGIVPQFRGLGYARLLLKQYLDEGHSLGYKKYRLDVHVDNQAAIRCYDICGFKIERFGQSRDGSLKYYSMTYEGGC